MLIGAILATAGAWLGSGAFQGDGLRLDNSTFERWKAYLAPKESELAFTAIAWKATFWEAAIEADRTSKPILLWAMNGHPLACT
jgi:hypothetical protein